MHLLLPYQRRWVADDSRVQVSVKSRRIGITWASALRAVIDGSRVGGMDTYYTGYKTDLAKEFIREAGDFARALNAQVVAEGEEMFQDVGPDGEPKDILAYTITFASGHRIIALSSSPRNLRGIQGRVIIDEAAFHDNLAELLKAALATLMWGGRVSIISTHNGADNPFNLLIENIKSGQFAYSLHETTLDDAIAEGLYERIAAILSLPLGDEAKAAWRKELIEFYGDGADEELFCIPRRGGGIYLPPGLVEACMSDDCKVHRIRVDDAFTHLPEAERNSQVDDWLTAVVQTSIHDREQFDPRKPIFIGEDFGRKSDITAVALGQSLQNLTLNVPAIFELRNVPFDAQQRFITGIIQRIPKFGRAAVDATGNGAPLGEYLLQRHGEVILPVGVVGNGWASWYPANLPHFKAAFEDKRIRIPRDFDIRQDLTAFQVVNGVPTLPKVRIASVAPGADKNDYRHGDTGVALALLEYAHRTGEVRIEHHKVETPAGRFGKRGAMW